MAYDDVFEADWSPTAGAQPIPRMKAPRTQEEENDVFSGDWKENDVFSGDWKATSPETDLTKPKPQKPWAEAAVIQPMEGIKPIELSTETGPITAGGAGWKTGDVMVELAELQHKNMWGVTLTEQERNRVAELKASMPQDADKLKLLEEALYSAGQLGPMMVKSAKYAAAGAATGAAIGAGAGAIAGGGVGALAGAAIGARWGAKAGVAASAFELEAGLAFNELLDLKDENGNRLDPEIARAAAIGIGGINAAIEIAQIKTLLGFMPGGQQVLRSLGVKAIKKALQSPTLGKMLWKAGKDFGKYAAKETLQEVSQEATNIVGEEIAKWYDELDGDKEFKNLIESDPSGKWKANWEVAKEHAERIGGIARQTALGMGVIGLPGLGTRVYKGQKQVRRARAEEGAPKEILTEAEELGFDPNQAKTFIETVYGGEASVDDLRAYQKELDPKTPTYKALEHAITQLTADESELEEIDLIEEQPRPQAAREDIGTVSPDKQQQAVEDERQATLAQAQEQIQAQAQAFQDYLSQQQQDELVQQEQTAMALPAQQELPVQPTTATQEETFYPEEVAPTTEEGMAMTGAPDIFTADWKPTEVQKAIPVEKQKPEGKTKEEPTGTGNISGAMTFGRLNREVKQYRGTGGIASEARSKGFRPAFRDTETGENYESNFKNGQPATIHLLEGLPDQVVLMRDEYGEPIEAKASLEAGFLKGDKFFTRDEAVAAIKAAQLKPEKRPATPATVTTAATEAKAPAKDDEAIRELMGLSQDRIDAYDPTQVVSKLGNKWTYTTYQGSMHPSSFDTRKEAIAAAGRHKELKQSQFDDPNGYFDLAALKAGKALIPSIVYHGTGKQFVDFTNPSPDAGYFFTSDRDAAKSFGERVVSAKLKLSNPYEDDAQGASFYDYPIQATIDMAKEKGFDGLILRNVRDYKRGSETKKPIDIFVAFQPEQIEQTGKPPAAGEQGQKEAAKEKEAMAKGKPAAVEAKPAELTVTEQLENIKVQPKPVKFVRKETGKEITLKFKKQSALKALNDIATKKQILENIRGCLG